jgi:SPP1 gp7 family putative phage head morphogenesis protein
MAMADMAGSLFVRDVELASRIKLDAQRRPTFLEMPFEEAVAFYEERFADPERTLEIIRAYRDRADDAGKRTLQKIADAMMRQIHTTLAQGGTLTDFADMFSERGFDAGYLENVYRTNVAQAYGAGRVREIEAVAEHVGFIEYVTAGDNRVRDKHRELDGKVWRADDPSWKTFAPPCGYQCRCSVVIREEGDFDETQLSRAVSLDWVDPAFRDSPTKLVTNPL